MSSAPNRPAGRSVPVTVLRYRSPVEASPSSTTWITRSATSGPDRQPVRPRPITESAPPGSTPVFIAVYPARRPTCGPSNDPGVADRPAHEYQAGRFGPHVDAGRHASTISGNPVMTVHRATHAKPERT